jgi:hypothetical protein
MSERELATLDESTLASSSADDLKKLFLDQEQKTINEESNEKESNDKEKSNENASSENRNEENTEEKLLVEDNKPLSEKIEEVKTRESYNQEQDYLRKQNQELLELLKNQTNNNTPKPEKKQLTPEEKLEVFTADPDAYVSSKVDEILRPQREKLKKLEEEQVFHIARNVSPDFKRLEPVIKKLMDRNPDYISSNVDPMKRLEGYYLLAEGLEAKYQREKNVEKENSKKAEQIKAKKVASSLPESTRKMEHKADKSVDKMSSKELADLIGKFKG